jgi:DNA polymerase I-like protein with 3'-5' exonuclease and polymerase domains
MPDIIEERTLEAYRLEMDLVPMVQAMRWRGIRMDMDLLQQTKDSLLSRSERALAQLSDRLKVRVGMDEIRSPGWLTSKFAQENVAYVTKTDEQSGRESASFEKDWMRQGYVGRYEEGRTGHWLPRRIAEAKQCNEAAERFVQGFLLDYAHRGRIHASVNQFRGEEGGTRSHRFSYSDPPLQQMPSRPEPLIKSWKLTEEIAGMVRLGFLPEEGEVWGALDYSQQEYRLIVHYACLMECDKAEEAADKYRNDPKTDFHNLVVELTGLIRQRAKDVNFAKSYGAGLWKFGQMTGMSEDEAKRTMEQYDGQMPFVKQLGGKCEKKAQHRGWIKLLDGARCHFDEWEVGWLDKVDKDRGWREGWKMNACSLEEACARVDGSSERAWRAAPDSQHPWFGKRLKRAGTHKAMNRLIQGGAARQTKLAMREAWRAGVTPLLQMHDELDFSFARTAAGRKQATEMAEIMRDVRPLRVPMMVDSEFGSSWGRAKYDWKKAVIA